VATSFTGSSQPDTQRQPKEKHMKKAAIKQASQQPPDDPIDLSDMPEIKNRSGATRGMVSRPELRLISIRLSAQDLATANQLAFRKGMPYQTNIKSLLHESLLKRSGATCIEIRYPSCPGRTGGAASWPTAHERSTGLA
jgi:predicted DNA binding CopG/RHH family protein